MTWHVELTRRAGRDIEALDVRLRRKVVRIIDGLSENPHPTGCRKLSNRDGLWRVRAGDYRVVYQVDEGRLVVVVVRVGHRREVYR